MCIQCKQYEHQSLNKVSGAHSLKVYVTKVDKKSALHVDVAREVDTWPPTQEG